MDITPVFINNMGTMPLFSLNSQSIYFPSSAGEKYFLIQTNYPIVADAGTIPTWITLNPTLTSIPAGDTLITISVTQNNTSNSRSAYINIENSISDYIGSSSLFVSQSAGTAPSYTSDVNLIADNWTPSVDNYLLGTLYARKTSDNTIIDSKSITANQSSWIQTFSNIGESYYIDASDVDVYINDVQVALSGTWEENNTLSNGTGFTTDPFATNTLFYIYFQV